MRLEQFLNTFPQYSQVSFRVLLPSFRITLLLFGGVSRVGDRPEEGREGPGRGEVEDDDDDVVVFLLLILRSPDP